MGRSTRVDSIRGAVAALNAGDVEGYLQRFDPACKRWVAGMDQPLSLENIRESLVQLQQGFEALTLNEDVVFGDETFVCARWRLNGVHTGDYMGLPPKGRRIDARTCEVYRFDSDVVAESWVYGDLQDMFRQITTDDEDA